MALSITNGSIRKGRGGGGGTPPADQPPGQVTGLTATPGDTQNVLAWSAVTASPAVTGYKIERRIGTGSWTTLVASHTGTSYTDTGLTNGTSYGYRVSAINSVGTGPASAEVTATPVAAAGVPPQVTGLTVTPGEYQNTLAWSATTASPAVTGYKVERRIGTGAWVTFVASQTGTSYVNTGLDVGVPYGYRATAINANGAGTPSAESIGTPTAAPTLAPLSGILDAPNVLLIGDSLTNAGAGGPSGGTDATNATTRQLFTDMGFTGTLTSLAVSGETVALQTGRVTTSKTTFSATVGQNLYLACVGINDLSPRLDTQGYEPDAAFGTRYTDLVTAMTSGGDKAIPLPLTKNYTTNAPFVVAGDPLTEIEGTLPYSVDYIYPHIPMDWMRPDGRPWVDNYDFVDKKFGATEPGGDGLHIVNQDMARYVLGRTAARALGLQNTSRSGKSLIYAHSSDTETPTRIMPNANIIASAVVGIHAPVAKFTDGGLDAWVWFYRDNFSPLYSTTLTVDQPTMDAAYARLPDARFHDPIFLQNSVRHNAATPKVMRWSGLVPGDTVQVTVAAAVSSSVYQLGAYTLTGGEVLNLNGRVVGTITLPNQGTFAPIVVPPSGTIELSVTPTESNAYVSGVILDFL